MFGIEWLRGQSHSPIERETSVLIDADAVIISARSRAGEVAGRHPGNEPDRFRLTDAAGNEIGIFPIGN